MARSNMWPRPRPRSSARLRRPIRPCTACPRALPARSRREVSPSPCRSVRRQRRHTTPVCSPGAESARKLNPRRSPSRGITNLPTRFSSMSSRRSALPEDERAASCKPSRQSQHPQTSPCDRLWRVCTSREPSCAHDGPSAPVLQAGRPNQAARCPRTAWSRRRRTTSDNPPGGPGARANRHGSPPLSKS